MTSNMNSYVKPAKQIRKDPADFVQLTRGYLRDMREMVSKSPAAFKTLLLLTERMNKTNAVIISQATIAQILGMSRTTVNAAVKKLEADAWLQVVKLGQVNGYVLNSKVVWRDRGGKRYASFYAEVIASEDEQVRQIEDWDKVELRQVPVIRLDEEPISDNADLPPPDQKDLLPPDRLEFPSEV